MDDYDYLYKIVLVGDSGTGKSNLLSMYVSQIFFDNNKTTIGVEFNVKNIVYDNVKIKAQIWDTAGQERYRAITSAYYRLVVGAIIVFDITKKNSFENVDKWIEEIKNHCSEMPKLLLVGNKSDLKQLREVSKGEIEKFCSNKNLQYVETSAKLNSNVEYAFEKLIIDIYNDIEKKNDLISDKPGNLEETETIKIIDEKILPPSENNFCC